MEKAMRRHSCRRSSPAFGGITLDDLGDFQIAAAVAVIGLKHRHRAHIADAQISGTVKAVYDQDGLTID